MPFYPEQNVRILSASVPAIQEVLSWAGGSVAAALHRLTAAIEALPPRDPAHDMTPGRSVTMERVGSAPAGRALLDGPVDELRTLAIAWCDAGEGWSTCGAALRQGIDGYLAGMARRTPPLVVGILNVTPDSFSDGGQHLNLEAALERGAAMVEEGADWIDVGGESTRPGAAPVGEEEELRRVLPVVRELARRIPIPISVDTRKSEVARRCLEAGATIVNDVSALADDPRMAAVAAEAGATVVLMHMPGDPASMQRRARYEDVVAETARHLRSRAEAAEAAGTSPQRIWIDPGIGFGKTVAHNLAILRRLREYTTIGLPLLVGTSRKSTIGVLQGGAPPQERLEGTAATVAAAVLAGAAAVRVHDVKEMSRVARVAWAVAAGHHEV